MRTIRFVYSVDFKALNKKLVVIYNSMDPNTPVVKLLNIDGEELLKEKRFENLKDAWCYYDEMSAKLCQEEQFKLMESFISKLTVFPASRKERNR